MRNQAFVIVQVLLVKQNDVRFPGSVLSFSDRDVFARNIASITWRFDAVEN